MENVIALAVLDKHSSCSETSVRAASRVRAVIPAAITVSVKGTALSVATRIRGYVMPGFGQLGQTTAPPRPATQTPNDIPSGHLTWSPPV